MVWLSFLNYNWFCVLFNIIYLVIHISFFSPYSCLFCFSFFDVFGADSLSLEYKFGVHCSLMQFLTHLVAHNNVALGWLYFHALTLSYMFLVMYGGLLSMRIVTYIIDRSCCLSLMVLMLCCCCHFLHSDVFIVFLFST
jgi:hypothetical protein